MKGILILAHGSRERATLETLNSVVNMVKEKLPTEIIEVAYMEFCEMTIERGLKNLLDFGVSEIKIVPYFLFEGIHIKKDIPKELEKFRKDNPRIKIIMGKTLGVDCRLSEIVVDRILE